MKKSFFYTVVLFILLVAGGMLGCQAFAHNQAVPHYNRGVALSNEGRYDEAIAEYDKAIEIDQKYTRAYNNRGNAYLDKKQYDLAIADFNKAIELDPSFALAYNNRGAAFINTKQFKLALSDFNKAIELDPKLNQAYTNRDIATKALGGITAVTTSTGKWANNNLGWGFKMNDQGDPSFRAGSTWTYDVVLNLEETPQGTFTGTMWRKLREITGPVTTVPEIMKYVGNTETASVSGAVNGTTVKLHFGALTLNLSIKSDSQGDYLTGDTYFYDPGSPVGQYKGLTDVRPNTGEYITWVYSINLKRQ